MEITGFMAPKPKGATPTTLHTSTPAGIEHIFMHLVSMVASPPLRYPFAPPSYLLRSIAKPQRRKGEAGTEQTRRKQAAIPWWEPVFNCTCLK
jgi:hypothetical protein